MKRAIVLSGGGSKGAYQMGVWKALKKLRIKYDIVTGTSVGALNAAMMTQKTFYKGLKLWNNLNSKMIFNEEKIMDYNSKNGKKTYLKKYAKGVLNGGLDVAGLETTILNVVNIKKFYSSKIDMGLITVNAKNLRPLILKKKDIKREKLADYLIASASCFPAFKMKTIDGKTYIDGGLYDNLPINLAVDMGATDIIAVDLDEVGFKQKVKSDKVNITYIKPRNNIGIFLVFEKEMSKRAIKFGYNDTLKTFKQLDGSKFTFKKHSLDKNFKKHKNDYINIINEILNSDNNSLIDSVITISILKRILVKKSDLILENDFNKILEKTGTIFELDETVIYKITDYNKILKKSFLSLKGEDKVERMIKDSKMKILLNNKATIKYIYNNLNVNNKKIYNLIALFPEEFLCAVYLKIIINKNF